MAEDLSKQVEEKNKSIQLLIDEVKKVIVGQDYMLERLIIGLLANGHVLVEGVPGLAKTTIVKTIAEAIHTGFQRIQFTPDLLPADLTGTQIYMPKDGTFSVKKGPIFSNIILADEINRAPAKVQSALLEAMQERQITIGETTFKLEEPFLVMATQNPIEQEGTYPLPEAQVDRFMLKLKITYPSKSEEKEIMRKIAMRTDMSVNPVITPQDILSAREVIDKIEMRPEVEDYIVDIIHATRYPEEFGLDIKNLIHYGASPRATIYLNQASKAHAFLQGQHFVKPHDIKSVAYDILRHRILLTYEAEAEEMTTDDVIKLILDSINVP